MINDFFKKFLTNNHIMDDYGLKYNYNYDYEVNKITNEYSAALLSNKILIKCSGLDAESFLNTQFTNDIKNLEKDEIILSGYCSPKGRLISVFYIFQSDKDYYLYTTLDTADALLKKLNMYKMMSKVEFNISKKILIGLNNIDKSKLPDYLLKKNKLVFKDDLIGFKLLENQLIIAADIENIKKIFDFSEINIFGYKSWDYLDIKNLLPFLTSKSIEAYTPQMLSLDLLGGVSFTKGCYPGQEIVARTHYLGEAKKSLFNINVVSKNDLNLDDKLLNCDEKTAGEIINVAKTSENSNKFFTSCLCVLRKEFIKNNLKINDSEKIIIQKGIAEK